MAPEKEAGGVRFCVWNLETHKLNLESFFHLRKFVPRWRSFNKCEWWSRSIEQDICLEEVSECCSSNLKEKSNFFVLYSNFFSNLLHFQIWNITNLELVEHWTLSFWSSRFQTRKRTPLASFSGANWQILCFSEDNIDYLIKSLNI